MQVGAWPLELVSCPASRGRDSKRTGQHQDSAWVKVTIDEGLAVAGNELSSERTQPEGAFCGQHSAYTFGKGLGPWFMTPWGAC